MMIIISAESMDTAKIAKIKVSPTINAHKSSKFASITGSNYYVNGILVNDTHVNQNTVFLGFLGGSMLISPVDSLAWITGEPNTNKSCVTLTWDNDSGTTGFQTQACNDDLEFFCGHSVQSVQSAPINVP